MAKAVFFDIDGTLVDSNDLHAKAWDEAFRHFGVELPYDRIRHQIGKGGDNLIPALLPKALVERRQQEIEEHRSRLYKRDYLPKVRPFAGVRPLFERLKGDGMRILLASSSHGDEVDHYAELLEVRDLVDATTSKDDVDHSKPCPDIFAAALAKVAPLGAEEVLVVGDTPYDVAAAGKIGIRTIGVRCGGFPDGELLAAGACALYDDPADLLERYDGSPLGRRRKAS